MSVCREVLDLAGKAVKLGATTDDVDRACHEAALERGAYPSPLNYFGFPKRCDFPPLFFHHLLRPTGNNRLGVPFHQLSGMQVNNTIA